MIQFSLDVWLEDKSRKVVTRTGEPVEIINHEVMGKYCIYAKATWQDGEIFNICTTSNGEAHEGEETAYDLFFADEEDGLTEFEKAIRNILVRYISNIDDFPETIIREAKSLLDLARKELQPEIDKEVDEALKTRDEIVYLEGYEKGQEDVKEIPSNPDYETFKNELAAYVEDVKNDVDSEESLDYWTDRLYRIAEEIALKDLPKWKKMPNGIQGNGDFKPTYLVRTSNGHYFTTPCLSWDEDSVYIELTDLKTLPKEE